MPRLAFSSGVIDATVGRGHRLETVRPDRLSAHSAGAVAAIGEPGQGPLDQVQLHLEHIGQRSVLALLGRDLSTIGEVVVEVEIDISARGQLIDALEEVGPFRLEAGSFLVMIVGHDRHGSGQAARRADRGDVPITRLKARLKAASES